ncbi:hypothetical protein DICPUDRAFT_98330 [Dictyostelium purpureum]|uniref:tRNA pseudouridine synthase Pus10 n=1 Tax=Dictyostelium purpureum TaxID=5786 RepID=F0ZPK9_DICPU|nr:uncharacterized protein DICPUDRAFT_98330 [Dictyostelium purpureum]EGC34102.1 hypothetical protein DICPUDRAFT_98330 [Dictyostelium purpureum]|eukprot:XP_003289348.1 hypothetical protein DICPUDRAFT_98330 [Dictyostelium purpureum]
MDNTPTDTVNNNDIIPESTATPNTTTTENNVNNSNLATEPKVTIVPDDESILKFVDTNLKCEKESLDYRNILFRVKTCFDRYIKKDHLDIVSPLHSNGVCPRCIFRFMSIREFALYQEEYLHLIHLIHFMIHYQKHQPSASSTSSTATNQDKMDTESVEGENKEEKQESSTTTAAAAAVAAPIEIPPYDPNSVELKNSICVCCLGILQDTNNKDLFLEEFVDKMKNCGYQFRDYSLALSLPTSTLVRDHAIFFYLRENYPTIYPNKTNFYEKVVEVKEGVKWVLGPIIGRRCNFQFKPSSDFRANMNYIHEESKDDHLFLFDVQGKSRKKQRVSTKRNKSSSQDSTSTVTEILDHISMKDFIANGNVPPKAVSTKYRYQLTFEHAPVYLSGKYNKYVRDLPQSPWQFDDNVNIKLSVEELITKDLKELFKCDQVTFSSSGREDVDVRMLGNGRPFFIELVNPHKIFFNKPDFEKLEESINVNTSIKVSNLQIITKKETNIIKDSGGTKQKDYRCIVWCSKPLQPSDLDILNSKTNIAISQQTPVRVLHRRSLMVRDKKVEKLKATYISPHFFTLDIINAQAGTYIKEFVHGDLGRTTPNIGLFFGCDTDILQLDVLNVDLDFPKPRK